MAKRLGVEHLVAKQKRTNESLQGACRELRARGMSAVEISEALTLDTHSIANFLSRETLRNEGASPKMSTVAEKKARREQAARRPQFCQVLQLLLPVVPERGGVELELLDRQKRVLGQCVLPLSQVIAGGPIDTLNVTERSKDTRKDGGPCLNGPFLLGKIKLEGSIWLRWVREHDDFRPEDHGSFGSNKQDGKLDPIDEDCICRL